MPSSITSWASSRERQAELTTNPSRWRRRVKAGREHGQATVELALILPIVAVIGWAFVELGLVLRDNVLCVHAAREAARALAVGEDPVAAAQRRSGLGSDLVVTFDRDTGAATVVLALGRRLPLLGRIAPGATLRQQATMRVETLVVAAHDADDLQRHPQQVEGLGLTQRFVAVPTLGRLHA